MVGQQKNTWQGTTSTDVVSERLSKQNRIGRFSIINKSAGNVSFGVRVGSEEPESVYVTNLNSVLAPGEGYTDGGIVVEDRSLIFLACDGEIDFQFIFDYTYPDGDESRIKPVQSVLNSSGFSTNSRIPPEL